MGIDLENSVHPFHVENDAAMKRSGKAGEHKSGSHGNHGDFEVVGEFYDFLNLFRCPGGRYGVGCFGRHCARVHGVEEPFFGGSGNKPGPDDFR